MVLSWHCYACFLASECNRLKLQLEDMKQMQEAKDTTIMTIQDQIQRLFEVKIITTVDCKLAQCFSGS